LAISSSSSLVAPGRTDCKHVPGQFGHGDTTHWIGARQLVKCSGAPRAANYFR
jgi:hypothetical protein